MKKLDLRTPNPEMVDDENPEWTEATFRRARPAADVLSATLQAKLGIRGRGPQKAPTKERITIRLSPDVLDSFRASGPGWQGRMDDALRDWLKEHEPA
ncbi:BrnA antitoxin family protein [Verticiella alkaliphila]|uniref:BrnA antitoxin family protein n=1 Tax=Verticiella alkaliphila TaxID=2779529 RepID=UPI00352FF027